MFVPQHHFAAQSLLWAKGYVESFNGKLRDELFEHALVHYIASGTQHHRILAARLQSGEAPQRVGICNPEGIRASEQRFLRRRKASITQPRNPVEATLTGSLRETLTEPCGRVKDIECYKSRGKPGCKCAQGPGLVPSTTCQ